jgi:thiamine biosynthesis lipoprotein
VFYILSFSLIGSLFFKPESPQPKPLVLEGVTMGTTYRVIYFDEPRRRNFQASVDSLLVQVNRAISTYDSSSEISRFNRSARGICFNLPYLNEITRTAREVYIKSAGAFDPTVMPLINAWGFGPAEFKSPSAETIDSLRQLTGFHKIRLLKRRLKKAHAGIQLDMGGIGQGYGADVVFHFLRSKQIANMLVELGGEGLAAGRNLQKNQAWVIGILDPNSTTENQFFKAYVRLEDKAFTTSGNYFNYRVVDGRKVGHTVSPKTGYPVQTALLSASVFADDCTKADAWATAFMVMGIEDAIARIKTLEGIDALFIYSNKDGGLETFVTAGIKNQITLE